MRKISKKDETKKEKNNQLSVEELKDELIFLTGHELKTPLTVINSILQLISEEKIEGFTEKQIECLGIVYTNIKRLNNIVDNMLDISQIEANILTYDLKEFDLKKLIEEQIEIASHLFEEKNASIEFEMGRSLDVVADRHRLGQILLNLLTNAIKYGKQKVHVWIYCKKKDDDVVIEVKDDGRGISKKNIPKLFNKMFGMEKSAEKIPGGLGFDLYLSKRIMEGLGGRIWVESKGLDKGSVFYVSFPIKCNNKNH